MRSLLLIVVAAVMLTAPILSAQDGRARQRRPDSSGGAPRAGEAAPRSAQPRSEPRSQPRSEPRSQPRSEPRSQPRSEPRSQPRSEPRSQPRSEPRSEPRQQSSPRDTAQPARVPPRTRQADAPARATADAPARATADEQAARRAAPRGDRDRGDNPRIGTAVPRQGPPPSSVRRDDDWRDDRRYGRVYERRGRTVIYNNYFTYPRRYFPFGIAGYGPGYYYYDRYSWYPYDPYRDRWDFYHYGYPTGEVRIDVEPTYAEVFVDGYYAGRVDDFDGVFQGLTLEEGLYTIEIVAPGFEPLVFDIRIDPGRKITYRGDLLRARAGDRYY